jgi:hypothetical protein
MQHRGAPATRLRRPSRKPLAALVFLISAAIAAPLVGIAVAGASGAPSGPGGSTSTGGSSRTVSSWNVNSSTSIVSGGAVVTTAAAAHTKPLLGGFSRDSSWYDATIGRATIYRQYDSGFHLTTWQRSYMSTRAGSAVSDLSLSIPPAQLANGSYDARLWTFIRTTPKNLIITNQHEPEDNIEAGKFTAAQYRAAIARLAKIVHGMNAADGGSRKVSTILMVDTLNGFKGRNPLNYWPGYDSSGKPYVDVLSFDTYAWPHGTGTRGVPVGYTDGVRWLTSAQLLDPVIAYAQKMGRRWMISEFGFLEDIHNKAHKGNAIIDFVNYARLHNALAVEYWDSVGRRADWRLKYGAVAVQSWKAVVHS